MSCSDNSPLSIALPIFFALIPHLLEDCIPLLHLM
uniref:Uncharacterized protein n=1 Tax=Manihot esculenta TaxID=3983 RepID=A0A2C9V666_MANES